MGELTVRAMKIDDYEIFEEFYSDLHKLHFEQRPDIFKEKVSLPPRDVFAKDLEDPKRAAFIAELDGKPVGMCMMSFHTVEDNEESPLVPHFMAHIDDIYTAAEHRRQGVATTLYKFAEKYAQDCGAEKLQLNVWSFNKNAIALYERLGMKPMFYKMEKML